MGQFVYRAFNAQGAMTSGTIVADGYEAAVEALYGNGLTPFETHEARGERRDRSTQADSGALWPQLSAAGRTDLNARSLCRFTVELSSLLGSGIALDEAFRVMAASDRGSVGRMASAILKDVLAGAQLSQAKRLAHWLLRWRKSPGCLRAGLSFEARLLPPWSIRSCWF